MNHHESMILAEQHRAELIDDAAVTRNRPRRRHAWSWLRSGRHQGRA